MWTPYKFSAVSFCFLFRVLHPFDFRHYIEPYLQELFLAVADAVVVHVVVAATHTHTQTTITNLNI